MRNIGYRNSCKKSMLSGSILVTTHKKETVQTCPLHKIPRSTFRVSTSGATPSGLTSRKGAWVKGLMRWQMPASTVQEITGIHGDTIRSIHKQTMDEALVRRWLQIRESGYRPTYLAVDGFAIHKGHHYATCVMDLGNGKVLWVGKGRPEADFAKFFEES